jgi:two-component system nitrogen regulation response regulator NtrX
LPVETAASGEACLKIVKTNNFACILLDIWLGKGIDGLETLKRLRDSNEESPVVMISGHGNIETAVKATKLGAFDFIEKPLSLEHTVITVKNAIRQRDSGTHKRPASAKACGRIRDGRRVDRDACD